MSCMEACTVLFSFGLFIFETDTYLSHSPIPSFCRFQIIPPPCCVVLSMVEYSTMSNSLISAIGGAWPSDYPEEQIIKDCELIWEHAKLRCPSARLEHLGNGPGMADLCERAACAIEQARRYLQEIEVIYSPENH